MLKKIILQYLVVILIMCCTAPSGAHAIDFKPVSSENGLNLPIVRESPSLYHYTKRDLNEDGVDEILLKSERCAPLCRFYVFAQAGVGTPIKIGQFEALKLSLSNRYQNGVRSLLLYKNTQNDFESEEYVWDMQQRRYIMREKL